MFPLQGTSGGQDTRRRAALQLLADYQGGGAQPSASPGAQPGAGTSPETDVAAHLQKAYELTLAQPDQLAKNRQAWISVMMQMKQHMPQMGQPQGSPTPQPSAMAAGGAQGAPMVGRPPR